MAGTVADTLIERRKRALGPAYELFYDDPLHLVRGEGVWLYDADGKRYLDMYNNVPHVGHCHPHVVAAISRQAATLNTHTRYLHENVVELAERLTARLPNALDVVMFSCTGSEANELALRIARANSGGEGIIIVDYAYHGNTHILAQASMSYGPDDTKPPYIETVPPPDVYRGEHRDDDAGERYALHVQSAVDALLRNGIKPAAFLVDTIVSSNGVLDVPRGYLKKAADVIRSAGGLFIADEVQPGFGRTGEHFWGFEKDGFEPDIVTMGKPIGNGHPLAATVTRADLAQTFAAETDYFNTFGGNPVSAAAGIAVLEVIEREALQHNAHEVGGYLREGLRALAGKFVMIGDIRGRGLFLGVDLVTDRESRAPDRAAARELTHALCRNGILTNPIGKHGNILKLRPPMVFTREHADVFLDTFDRCLSAHSNAP